MKVLLVDDDYLVRMYLKQIIDWEKEGLQIVADACNGKEALELLEEERPDIVITDISMPVMGGIELISHILDELSKKLLEYANERPVLGYSDVSEGDGNITHALGRAEKATALSFYAGKPAYFTMLPTFINVLPKECDNLLKKPEKFSEIEAMTALEECKQNNVDPKVLLEWIEKLDGALGLNEKQLPRSYNDCLKRIAIYAELSKSLVGIAENKSIKNALLYINKYTYRKKTHVQGDEC